MKKGIIYLLATIFTVSTVGSGFEMPLNLFFSNSTISQQTTAKNQRLHQKFEKTQHRKSPEKFLKTTLLDDNFQALDLDNITFFGVLSLFSSLIFLLTRKYDFIIFLPNFFRTSKRYLVLQNIRI